MKKVIIPFFIAIIVATPFCVYAFNLGDVFGFGKSLVLRTDQKTGSGFIKEMVVEDVMKDNMIALERDGAVIKYENWKKAFENKSLASLYDSDDNFLFSENEFNYILEWFLSEQKNPIARDLKVDLTSDGIILYGYSNLKNFKGDFEMLIKITEKKGRVYPKVTKARLGNFPFPAFIASAALRNQIIDAINFLYSEEKQNWHIFINEDYLRLEY